MNKYNYNENYFEKIDSGEKAYWLGFLYADGYLQERYKNDKLKSIYLAIGLCIQDKHHLEKFAKALESDVPIKERVAKCNGKEYRSCTINICSTKMCCDLINLGCIPRKTFSIKFPTQGIVPKEYMRYWLEGFFDGDGCICVTQQNGKPHIEITITGIESMLESINAFLVDNEIITKTYKIYKSKKNQACSTYYYGNNAKRFLDYIYGDTSIYLDRKYNKYLDFYKDYTLIDTRGVYWDKTNKAYVVSIYINGERKAVGRSKSLEEAVKMRKEAEIAKNKMARLDSDV